MKRVNIGCGSVFHPGWINRDVEPFSDAVRARDALRELLFPDSSVDAVYHSHVLEHLRGREGGALLVECARVLRPGGIIRIAVPDLEGIARGYLAALDLARKGGETTGYDWMVLEMTDQLTREASGGEMLEYLRRASPEALEWVRERSGADVAGLAVPGPRRSRSWRALSRSGWRRLRIEVAALCVAAMGGRAWARAFRAGLFRESGEVHRRMYDDFSLARALTEAGFSRPMRKDAGQSEVEGFAADGLEVRDGAVRKPDSLFMEARKPAAQNERERF